MIKTNKYPINSVVELKHPFPATECSPLMVEAVVKWDNDNTEDGEYLIFNRHTTKGTTNGTKNCKIIAVVDGFYIVEFQTNSDDKFKYKLICWEDEIESVSYSGSNILHTWLKQR